MGKEVINRPLLSVIIPCFNAAPYLRQCVENLSVICPYEIIIVDDGSTDDTRRIGLELQSQHNYIRLVSQDNKGVSVARFEGWRKSVGEYVTFLDVDDKIIVSEDVTSLLNGRYDIIKTAGYYVNGEALEKYDNRFQGEIRGKEKAIGYMLDGMFMPFIHSAIYRRTAIDESCFESNPRFKIGEDLLFNMKLFGKDNLTILSIDAPIYYYVQQPTSVMHTKIWGFDYINAFNDQLTNIVDESVPSLHHKAVEHRFQDYLGTLMFPEVKFKKSYYEKIIQMVTDEPELLRLLPAYKRMLLRHSLLFRPYLAFIHILQRLRGREKREVLN